MPTNFTLFVLRDSSLYHHPHDASVDITDDEGYSEFAPETEFASILQETLK